MLIHPIHKLYADSILSEVIVSGTQKGINFGLNFSPAKAHKGKVEILGVNVFYPDKKRVYLEKFEQCKLSSLSGVVVKDLRILLSEFIVCLMVSNIIPNDFSAINEMVDFYFKSIEKEPKQYIAPLPYDIQQEEN